MNPPLKTTGLFLTPRGPYGRRLPERVRKHLRASEDEKPDPTPKEMQGLGGQMAPSLRAKAAYLPAVPSASVPSTSLAAQMAPPNPRWTAPDKVLAPKPVYTPAADSGVLLRPPTEEEKQQKQTDYLMRGGRTFDDLIQKEKPESGLPLPGGFRAKVTPELEKKPGEKVDWGGKLEIEKEQKKQR
jgi:hypothetical protein